MFDCRDYVLVFDRVWNLKTVPAQGMAFENEKSTGLVRNVSIVILSLGTRLDKLLVCRSFVQAQVPARCRASKSCLTSRTFPVARLEISTVVPTASP